MKEIQLVIFDLDGTLVDAYQAVSLSINTALKKMNLMPIDDDKIKRSVGWGERHLARSLVSEEYVDTLLQTYRGHHEMFLRQGTFFLPGAKNILDYLSSEGVKLAIATNRSQRFTSVILDHLEIRGHFDYVLCGDQIERPKPAPDILENVLQFFSLGPKDALYVGDMTIDAQAGQQAGVRTVVVLTGSSTKAEVEAFRPCHVISRIADLVGILE
ncbi:MAG: HAD family hydrolase [Candidatus Omnitrophica bacterium]|nr:HAD family hydrolase [Candidatus Omnitrophota bacterium]